MTARRRVDGILEAMIAAATAEPVEKHRGRRLNGWLDHLPRTNLGSASREVPAFFACAVAGFYAALVVLAAGGLLTGRSLTVLAAIAAICAGSFFVWALGRRAITGRETLVLLEHVWFAELCVAGALALAGEPVLAYLDVMAPALCVFLAAGRVGCLVAGCCHGRPSSIGIAYGVDAVGTGFEPHLVGVRLLPVPALEALALLVIGLSGLVALPFAAAGTVFTWFLVAYAVTRFGLERLRGDERPRLLGMSINRWMCVAELAVAVLVVDPPGRTDQWLAAGAVALALLGTLIIRHGRDPRRRLLQARHLAELTAMFEQLAGRAASNPELASTSDGVNLAVSRTDRLHASLSTPGRPRDLWVLCGLAAALPGVDADTAILAGNVLHVTVEGRCSADPAAMYGRVVRSRQ